MFSEPKKMPCFPICSALSVVILLLGVPASSFGFNNETDQQALLAVKSQITDAFGVLSSWNGSIHFCNWNGVKCSRRHQRVVSLNLSSLRLAGNISPHVGNLSFLRDIDLGNNSFHGTIPEEVGRLYLLQNLILWNNSLEGELPRNFTRCSKLEVILLNSNKIGGDIPHQLGSLTRLKELGLAVNSFVGQIPPSLGNLSSLLELSLGVNSLGGSIPLELGQLYNLRFLQLGLNNLSGTVPEVLYNISSLEKFGLYGNRLHGRIPADLGFTLPNLQDISIGENLFFGTIPSSLANCSGLVKVTMNTNALTGLIPDNFGALQRLQLVCFDYNQLGRPNSNDLGFITSLANCTSLRALSMIQNNLRGPLPESIGNLSSKLSYLRLSHNNITGRIPSEVGTLVGLERLGLGANILSGHIPDTIGRLPKLRELYIFENRMSGNIPSSIGNLTQLSILNLRDNLLEGVIHVSLGDCAYLQMVYLSNNHLEGDIPALSSSIVGLFLGRNNLSGTLPSKLSNLRYISWLDVSENRLSGRIPSALEACQVLEFVYMSGNTFEGTLPSSFSNLRSLQVLDLSRNNLSGPIPYFLGELPLTNLDLSFNKFEGEVPTNGVFKNASAFSVLGNNQLCGGIKELQLAACPTKASGGKKHFSLEVVIAISTAPFIIFLLACFILIKYRNKQSGKKPSDASPSENKHPRLAYATLLEATDGFSSTNLIGKGKYGLVYKGILRDDHGTDQSVAIKVFNHEQEGANRIFVAECEALKTIKHRNIVKISTSCSSIDFQGNDFKALVFEFMPKGSLQDWLHPNSSEMPHSRCLNFVQRLNIAIDIASALHYLHTQCSTPVVHCDLKPSNILLNNDLSACVSDFGLTKFLSMARENSVHDRKQSSSIGVGGTIGYIAPEYGVGEEVSTFGDVYSYGILLMELFTGKSPTSSMFTGHFNLHDFVKASLPGRLTELIDPRLLELEEETTQNMEDSKHDMGNIIECLVSVCQIGLMCSAQSRTERLDTRDVLAELIKIKEKLLKHPRGGRGRNRGRRRINHGKILPFVLFCFSSRFYFELH